MRPSCETIVRSSYLAAALAVVAFSATSCSRDAASRAAASSADTAVALTYERSLQLEDSAATSANISFGDLDGDGHLDIVLAKGRHWPLRDRVLLGDGHGGIRTTHDLAATEDRTYSGVLVDLDDDGDLDVVISNDSPDPKLVHLNDGSGHFRQGTSFGRAEWPTRNARVGDMNGDGRPDIIVANRGAGDSHNYICLNRGQGRFDAACSAFSNAPATTVTPADFDGDGRLELVVPHRDGGQSLVHYFDGDTTFARARTVPWGPADASFRMAEAADFDGDGVLDIVAIDERRGAAIYFGARDSAFARSYVLSDSTSAPYALAVADLDGDGDTDIIVGHIEAQPSIYFNDGTGRGFRRVRFGDNLGSAYGFAVGDLDEDGLLDIGVARSDAPNIVYFARRNGSLR